jgi:peptide-methionine (S)-S-oxide reductase
MILNRFRPSMVSADRALKGRAHSPFEVPADHAVSGRSMHAPFPEGYETVVVGMGCFSGAERRLWQTEGVWVTAVGYAGGYTAFPTYEETCTGSTGHTEVVLVVYDPAVISLEGVLKVFWESHDPTEGYRPGHDVGTQYRSAVYWTTPEHEARVRASAAAYDVALQARGRGHVTTELRPLHDVTRYFYAEGYHQQYLHKNPGGYCSLSGTGVTCPI